MGAPRRCPRTGGLGQRQHLFLRRFLRSKKRNSTAAKARAGKNSWWTSTLQPPSPAPEQVRYGTSLFARPSENYQKSASGFSRKKVRILFKTDSQFVKFRFPASLGASPLASANSAGRSANEFSSNFQTSQSFFARRAKAKRQFSTQKRLQI